MQTETLAVDEATEITGIAFVSAYVDDYAVAYTFYSELLGLKKQYDMGEQSCFFTLGSDWGLYLEGGNSRAELKRDTARSAFTLSVASAFAMFERLKAADVKIVQSEPMDMGQGVYWFQFFDPSGNILEILGGK